MNDNVKVAKGVVANDPAASLPVGAALRFQAVPVVGDIPAGTATLNNWEYFKGVVLALSFSDNAHLRVHGSAVLVAPGIALAAAHVVASHLDELLAGRTAAMCHGIASHGQMLWHVRKVTLVPNSDIVILGLVLASTLPPENLFLQSIITTRTPAVGEELLVCGFRATEHEFPREDAGVQINGAVWVCRGEVTERYPTGRDRSMLPWPVLEISVSAGGGMSGGPVYDLNGQLVGLLCSSIELSEHEGLSYVSLVWPALAVRFERSWPGGFQAEPISLLEMDSRLCVIENREAVVREEGSSCILYHEWE